MERERDGERGMERVRDGEREGWRERDGECERGIGREERREENINTFPKLPCSSGRMQMNMNEPSCRNSPQPPDSTACFFSFTSDTWNHTACVKRAQG